MYLIVLCPLHSQCHHSHGLTQITNSLLPGSSASNLSPFPISSTDFGSTWFLKLLSSQQFLSPEAIYLPHEIQILITSQAPEQPFPPLYPSVFLSVHDFLFFQARTLTSYSTLSCGLLSLSEMPFPLFCSNSNILRVEFYPSPVSSPSTSPPPGFCSVTSPRLRSASRPTAIPQRGSSVRQCLPLHHRP